jgi:chemotaxis receptor (MCP) glutamine deamidase CheD
LSQCRVGGDRVVITHDDTSKRIGGFQHWYLPSEAMTAATASGVVKNATSSTVVLHSCQYTIARTRKLNEDAVKITPAHHP